MHRICYTRKILKMVGKITGLRCKFKHQPRQMFGFCIYCKDTDGYWARFSHLITISHWVTFGEIRHIELVQTSDQWRYKMSEWKCKENGRRTKGEWSLLQVPNPKQIWAFHWAQDSVGLCHLSFSQLLLNSDQVFTLPPTKMQIIVLSFLFHPVSRAWVPFSLETEMFAMHPCSVISTVLQYVKLWFNIFL